MALGPLRFHPILKQLVWGGRRLETLLDRQLPEGESIGESWELVDLPGSCSVAASGSHAGQDLRQLVSQHPKAMLGEHGSAEQRFPILVKLLDAHRVLSVQVHPDASTAQRLGGEARSKTEAWFILHAEPKAKLYVGLRPGTRREDFAEALRAGEIEGLLQAQPARAGDVFLLEAGTIHALGAGIVLVEVQELSDTTYRVFDWGRLGLDGRPRALHIEEALEAIHFDAPAPGPAPEGVVACPAFHARWERSGGQQMLAPSSVPRILTATSKGHLEHEGRSQPFITGDTVLLPAGCAQVTVLGASYICVTLPSAAEAR